MTPQEEINNLLKQYKDLTGRNLKLNIDSSSTKDLAANIKLLKDAISGYAASVDEITDNFQSTLSTLVAVQKELNNIEKTVRSKLRPEYNNLNRTILEIKNTNREISNGYINERKIQKQLNDIIISRANIQTHLNASASVLNQYQKQQIHDLLEITEATENLAKEQLNIAKYSKESAENISNFDRLLYRIPIIGKLLARPFRKLSEEIVGNTAKAQALNLQIGSLKNQINDISKSIESNETDKNTVLGIIRKDGRFNWVSDDNIEGMKKIAFGFKGISQEIKDTVLNYEKLTKKTEELTDIKEELNEKLLETEENLKRIPKPIQSIIATLSKISLVTLSVGILVKTIDELKDIFVEVDEQSSNLSKSFYINRSEALKLREELNKLATDAYITTKELVESQIEFTKLTGLSIRLTGENLKTLSEMKNFMGLSEQSQKSLISFSEVNNKNWSETLNNLLGTSVVHQTSVGLLMDQKEIIEEISNVSAELRIQFANNVQEITKAVIETKRLGFNLKDIEGIQNNLLNFESSISAELEAELLVGKELNLEKARYLSLTGNVRGLTQEIVKQGMSLNKWENLNLIQRESYAKAVGTSSDRLSEILITNEQNNRLAKSLNNNQDIQNILKKKNLDLTAKNLSQLIAEGAISKDILNVLGEEEKQRISTLSVNQKFERTIQNLKEAFVGLIDGPMGFMIKGVNQILNTVNSIPVLKQIVGFTGIIGVLGAIGVISAAVVNLATKGTMSNPMITKDITGMLSTGTGIVSSTVAKGLAIGSGLGVSGMLVSGLSEGTKYEKEGDVLGSTLMGAGIGASIGSIVPVLGTATGGLIGAGIGALTSIPALAEGGIVNKPTVALTGEKGREAVIPLDEFYAKIDKLISAVENKQNLYFDGRLVSDALSIRTFK